MNELFPDTDPLAVRKRRETAAAKYKPSNIQILLVAEAPPRATERYFYFDDVTSNDWLFRGVIEALFDEKPCRSDKARWLEQLRLAGIFVIDVMPDPVGSSELKTHLPSLVARCKALNPERIILIKVTVFDTAFEILKRSGLPVINKRIYFPSTGRQAQFRTQFKEALALCP